MMRKFIILFIIFFISVEIQVNAQNEITADEIYEHIDYLASDKLQGRLPGTKYDKKSAKYIAREFKKAGCELLADKGFQKFEIVTQIKTGKRNKLAGSSVSGKLKQDYMPLSLSENGKLKAEVVFCGYGFDVAEKDFTWNDFANVNVKGKWAMILLEEPEIDENRFMETSIYSKIVTAKDKGAAGILFVNLPDARHLISLFRPRNSANFGIKILNITSDFANQLLKDEDFSVESYLTEVEETKTPRPFETSVEVVANVDLEMVKTSTQNIVAYLPGSDPELKDEYVIFGAHYDHLGIGGHGSGSRQPDTTAIHNGADDNASGVAAVIEIAEKLAANQSKLKRSALFMAFGAEEKGLIGSKYYTKNPLLPIDKAVIMYNFDMVGRLKDSKEITIYGTGTFKDAENYLSNLDKKSTLSFLFSKEGYGPSDHASFYAEDIPVLFFSTGLHPDYHTPVDDIEFINAQGQKLVVSLAYDIAYEVLTGQMTPEFTKVKAQKKKVTRTKLKVKLGIMPGFGQKSDIKGLRIDGVREKGPAGKAGLEKGDIITGINGKSVENIYDYMERLKELNPGDKIEVEILRDENKEVIPVQL